MDIYALVISGTRNDWIFRISTNQK